MKNKKKLIIFIISIIFTFNNRKTDNRYIKNNELSLYVQSLSEIWSYAKEIHPGWNIHKTIIQSMAIH